MAERRLKNRLKRHAYVWSAGMATLLVVLSLALLGSSTLDRLTGLVFDAYQQMKPRQQAGAPVAFVDIDEASIRAEGQWPWPRSRLAALVDRLGELGAAAIAFDMVFPEPDRTSLDRVASELERLGAQIVIPAGAVLDNDQALAAAFARNPVVAGFVISEEVADELAPPKTGFAFGGSDPESFLLHYAGGLSNLPILTEAAPGMGFFSFPASRDGIIRTIPLVTLGGGNLYPALSVEALRLAQGAGSFMIRGTGASGEADTGLPSMTALKVGAFEVPTGPDGSIWIYYSGLPDLAPIPAASVLDPAKSAALAERIAGHIVLLGSSSIGLRDIVATPLSTGVPGSLVHAEIIDQIMSGSFLSRPDWARGAEVFAALAIGIALLIVLASFGPVVGALAATLFAAIAVGLSWFAFDRSQLLFDPILPAISVISVYISSTGILLLLTDRERQYVRRAFSHYLAPELVERLADDPSALALGGETREITVLFSDIRGFTSISEGLDPQALTKLLNDFLTPMTDILLKSGATIDKYIGDAIMCFWNAPVPIADHQRVACLATLAMQRQLAAVNANVPVPIKIGIGLNTGLACVGNLGSEQRFSYSALGDTVNLSSRIEGLTKQYQVPILISETTAAGAKDLAIIEADRVRVIGRSEPVALCALLGDESVAASPDFHALAEAHEAMLRAYRAQDFDLAVLELERARSLAAEDVRGLYDVYEERIADMRAEPPGTGWDGVFTARSK